ncbi:MAG: hypothetical protein OEY14_10245 [Myxococcales bacterium]|nr:hypothetical protein [Myxococcales bacterium]
MPSSEAAIVVGLGTFGAGAASRLIPDADEDTLGRVLAPAPCTPEERETITERICAEARRMLSHGRLVRRRDRRSGGGPTRLLVIVLAHLGERSIRASLGPCLEAIERALLLRFAPIFERYRVGEERNLVLLPLLAMPHPGGHPQGEEIASTARALAEMLREKPARDRAIPQLYLIEDVAELSVLCDEELEDGLRNFATLLLEEREALPNGDSLLFGRDSRDPVATFACAIAELPRRALRAFATDHICLELLDAIGEAVHDPRTLPELDALEEVQLAGLAAPQDAEADIRALLDRYASPVERDPEPRPWIRAEALLDRYGPDPGDWTSEAPTLPAEAPQGFALEQMRRIEAAWRLLQRRRFDDLVERERRDAEHARELLLESMRGRVDRELFGAAEPDAFARAGALLETLERTVGHALEAAVAERNETHPAPAPSFESFRSAHAEVLDAARAKPDLRRSLFWGVLSIVVGASMLPALLRSLADALSIGADHALGAALREHPQATALALSATFVGLTLGLAHRRGWLRLRDALRGMWDALEATVRGPQDSLLAYFSTRLELSRRVGRVQSLLALEGQVRGDAERLRLIDRARRRAAASLREAQRRRGIDADAEGYARIEGLLWGRKAALIEPLIGSEGGLAILETLAEADRPLRVRELLETLLAEERWRSRWREALPFASIEALRKAASPQAQATAEWDPFASAAQAEAAATRIAAFIRRQARSLDVALNYTGRESQDASGQSRLLSGEAVVPEAALEGVRRHLGEEGAAGRALIPLHAGKGADRAFYAVAVTDISEASIASIAPNAPLPAPEGPLRFEIEEGADA